MLSHALYFILLLPTTIAAAASTYNATDFILLNCGASSNLNDNSNRNWDRDDRARYTPPNAATISSPSTASVMDPSVFAVPYQTARVFHSPFTYTFPLLTGPKFLRLYFYPGIYPDFNAAQSYFSVTANSYTLLGNFSAFLNSPLQPSSFMKEFLINIDSTQKLDLTFSPNPNSTAFVNGIEIVSTPDTLYFKGNDVPIKSANQLSYLNNDTILENLYRLNVGGSRVEIQNDSGMFRAWSQDDEYFEPPFSWTPHVEDKQVKYTAHTPSYSAPPLVYLTCRVMGNSGATSLDWKFSVDSGFYYLVRLHFCEILPEIILQYERVFTISINNEIEEIQADVIFWTGGNLVPVFKDYITWIPNDGGRGKRDLRLSLFPMNEGLPKYSDALLNGLEIFKLNDSNGSLAASNPNLIVSSASPAVKPKPEKRNRMSSVISADRRSVIGVLAAAAAAVSFIIFRRRRNVKDLDTASVAKSSWIPISTVSRSTTKTSGSGVSLPSDPFRYFPLN